MAAADPRSAGCSDGEATLRLSRNLKILAVAEVKLGASDLAKQVAVKSKPSAPSGCREGKAAREAASAFLHRVHDDACEHFWHGARARCERRAPRPLSSRHEGSQISFDLPIAAINERLRRALDLQRNNFHAGAIAFADVVLGEFEALSFEQLHEPRSGKVVVVLELAPIRVRTRRIENPPNDRIHIRHRDK